MARLFALCLLSLFCLVAPARAQTFNAQEQAEIRAIVREYLVNNPDVLREALDALELRTTEERWRVAISDSRDFSIGPANAPIVIVEFYDYRCPYCHAALEWVTNVVETRNDVRVVFKELPVLGPNSLEASRAAIAAMPQGRYWAFHRALMEFRGDLSSERINTIARQSGVDVARMRRVMDSRADSARINEVLTGNQALAAHFGVTGTPGFLINGELVSGFQRDRLDARLREATRETRGERQAAN